MQFSQLIGFGLLLLLLSGCGNKGDLFLVPTGATEETLESIDDAIDALDQETLDNTEFNDSISESERDKKKNEEN